MRYRVGSWLFVMACAAAGLVRAEPATELAAILGSDKATFTEQLAAREVQRYVYLRTGKLLPMVRDLGSAPAGGVVLVSGNLAARLRQLGLAEHPELRQVCEPPAAADQYWLKTIAHQGRQFIVAGGEGRDAAAVCGLSPGRALGRAVLLAR